MDVSPHTEPGPLPLALVVDPDWEVRELYATALMPAASEIEYAQDGREALAKAIGRPPSLVITETRLPFIDGYALCSLLRADPVTARVPIIVVAGNLYPSQIEWAHTVGADAVLAKPCRPETLLTAVAQVESAAQRPVPPIEPPPATERRRRFLVRAHQRFETTTPPATPPALRCPRCDRLLQYVRSHIGGVSERFSEQWDYFVCSAGCGTFQYRQRTRRVRRMP
jgi:two-component system, cell cycle response regulator DivK